MATFKVALKDRPKKDGTFPIVIRIRNNKKKVEVALTDKYSVRKELFQDVEDKWVISKHTDYKIINGAIADQLSSLRKAAHEANVSKVKLDIAQMGKSAQKGGVGFYALVEKQLAIFKQRHQVLSYRKNANRLNNLKEAWGYEDIPVNNIDKELADKFVSVRMAKKVSPNSIKKDLSFFSGVLRNFAGGEEKNVFVVAKNVLINVSPNKERLTKEEIKMLEGVQLDGPKELARDMFLFSYYTNGMRFGDAALIERSQIKGDKIVYQMNKTKKNREIPIYESLRALIDKYQPNDTPYLFPLLKEKHTDPWLHRKYLSEGCTYINYYLDQVADDCGFETKLRTHIARHSFAYHALQKGVSYPRLKQMLGHSDFRTTQGYLQDLQFEEVHEGMEDFYKY